MNDYLVFHYVYMDHLRVPFGLQLHSGSLFEYNESIYEPTISKKSRKHKLKKNKTLKR